MGTVLHHVPQHLYGRFRSTYKGVRLILKNLVRRFRELGGELLLRKGVKRICVEDSHAVAVELDNGDELQGKKILSSAGRLETIRMCDDVCEPDPKQSGQLSFIESISIIDRQPEKIGIEDTIVFYNDSDNFHWERPDGELCDTRTGVICSPNNYVYSDDDGKLADGVIRITTIADYDRWNDLSEDEYRSKNFVGTIEVSLPAFPSRVISDLRDRYRSFYSEDHLPIHLAR